MAADLAAAIAAVLERPKRAAALAAAVKLSWYRRRIAWPRTTAW